MKKSRYEYPVPERQDDSVTIIANPVSGTKYEWRAGATGSGAELGIQKNVRIISIFAALTWATTQPTPLEVHVTLDGEAITHTKTDPVSLAGLFAERTSNATPALQGFGAATLAYRPFIYEGRLCKIEIEITWAVTQPTDLTLRVKWARW